MDSDILHTLDLNNIKLLIDVYKNKLIYPQASYIYNYLKTVIKWKTQVTKADWITLYAPYGDLKNGTFVGIHEFSCYEIILFTFEETCETLCDALVKTNKIIWSKDLIIYSIYGNHYSKVSKALKEINFELSQIYDTRVLWISKEIALKFELNCSEDVFISELEIKHAEIINLHWPTKYKRGYRDSQQYLAKFIEMNGGYGIFLKSNGKLVAWSLQILIGFGALQTLDDYQKKGYGSLVAKAISKKMAQNGFDPLGTVIVGNNNSSSMLKKIGFCELETLKHIASRHYVYSD